MKELFAGYYTPTENDFLELWKNATFIFDTNVLLNLYRYQSTTKDQLLEVMGTLSERIWIPHHVGLEFQRNRLVVIAQQQDKYEDVKNIISNSVQEIENKFEALQLKKRHSHINPDKLIKDIQEVTDKFESELKKSEEESITISSDDAIREKIDKLFFKKIGPPPNEQSALEDIYSEGENRYEMCFPPGFKDTDKDEDQECFSYGGLTYKRKFGDLIVWKQIIDHAKKSKTKNVIFVTDDAKSDWWFKVKNKGSKTIGARPELIDEIIRDAGVERFHIYNTEKFLQYAKKQIDAKVTDAVIEDVRDVTHRRIEHQSFKEFRSFAHAAEIAVFKWLSQKFTYIEHQMSGFPDIVAQDDAKNYGFEVKIVRDARMLRPRIDDLLFRAYHSIQEKLFDELSLVFVVLDKEDLPQIVEHVTRMRNKRNIGIKIIAGIVDIDEESGKITKFVPAYQE